MKKEVYNVSFHDEATIIMNEAGIKLYVQGETLVKIIAPPFLSGKINLTIPHSLENGIIISEIKLEKCRGVFGEIVISSGITKVGEFSFDDTIIDSVVWPDTCEVIPGNCFSYSSIKRISGIENVKSIEAEAFYPSELSEIIGDFKKLETIGNFAFSSSKIKKIAFPAQCSLGSYAFDECRELEKVDLPANCSNIPEGCFSGCINLKEIFLPPSVVSMGACAFSRSGIVSFQWPPQCQTIPDMCFFKSSLTSITNLDNVKQIEGRAFANCEQLKSVKGICIIDYVKAAAFAYTGFTPAEQLDLSKSIINTISNSAFIGIAKDSVKRPYFVNDEEFDSAFT